MTKVDWMHPRHIWTLVAIGLIIPYVFSSPGSTGAIVASGSVLVAAVLAAHALSLPQRLTVASIGMFPFICVVAGGAAPILDLQTHGPGSAGLALWLFMAGYTIVLWQVMALLAADGMPRLISRGLVAATFGVALLWYWQVIVVGFDIPHALLPAPSAIGVTFADQIDLLWSDFLFTFFLSVVPGFLIGSGAGFLFAILVDGRPFLARGLLPLGSAFSAIPIVAVAPIMIMWFGSGSESKAAVVVLMTFFPMMVNVLSGLNTVDRMELDLMRSYGAGYWTRLFKLRLPTALPFVFNALKINATLAMIGAIVSEFFGSPLAGMGFRISAMIGRLNLEMVWSTIAVAAIAGSLFYGLWAVLERVFTFWHPAQRR